MGGGGGENRLESVIYDLGIPISRFPLHMSPRVATVTTLLCRLTSPSILSNCTGCVCMFGPVMCVWKWNACVNARKHERTSDSD